MKQNKKPPLMYNFIAFSVVLFLVILIAGSGAFVFSMLQIIKTNKGNELSQMLEIGRIKLENSVNKELAIALKMASSPLIQHYFINPNDTEQKEIAFREIADYRRVLTGSVFWVSDIDKRFYFDDREPYMLDTQAPEHYWYPMTLNETEDYNFNINYNPDLNITDLWINVPVFDSERKAVGMVGTGVNLSEFINMVYKAYTDKAQLYFFNAAGEITGARDVELVAAKKKIEDEFGDMSAEIFSKAKKLKPGETLTYNIPDKQVAIGTVPTLDWYSVAFSPIGIKDYNTAMTELFLVMLAVIVLIFVIFNIFIAKLLKPLRQTMKSLEATSKYKSDFLAKMSHEIRTPMNAIAGMSELALRENMPVTVREYIITIKQASANLLSIINDILDFSKIESGKLEIVPSDYLFSSLVNDVISIIRTKVIDSGLRFVVNVDSKIPNHLFGDETRIRQVLLNVLSNAVKYTKKGFISLSINKEIMEEDTVLLTIDVADSGQGIKPEDLEKLFGDFIQVDLVAHRGVEGTGLGLAITKTLVKAMGGKISVHSEYGKGSTFTITLPQKIASHKPLATVENPEKKSVLVYERRQIYADSMICNFDKLGVSFTRVKEDEELHEKLKAKDYSFIFVPYVLLDNIKKAQSEFGSKAQIVVLTGFGNAIADNELSTLATPVYSISIANILNGVSDNTFSYSSNINAIVRFHAPEARILVVDDINTNLQVTEGLLLPYNMQVDLCLSGVEAIQAARKNRYDLIFMDHMMPEMDGIEATKRIRELGAEYLNLPIIALTANAVSGMKDMFLANGLNDFLSKPINTVKLNAILEEWLPKEKQIKVKGEAKAGDESDLSIEIDGVDVKKGIAIVGGKAEDYLQILAVFHSDGTRLIEEIKKSLEADDYHLYTTHAHALKSASATIGADEISEAAKALEMAGHQKDFEFIKLHNMQFLTALQTLLDNISTVLLAKDKPGRKI